MPDERAAPYALPLAPAAFREALRCGHGRALLHAREHGVAGFHDDIVAACVRNLAHDPQLDGERATWMLGLLDAAGATAELAPRLIAAAEPLGDDASHWDDHQRSRLLMGLARRGHDEARTQLYGMLRKLEHSYDLVAAREILELDGDAGLRHVCAWIGRWLADGDPDERDPQIVDFELRDHERARGEGSVLRVLEEARASDPDIERFLVRWDEECAEEREPRAPGQALPERERPTRKDFGWTGADVVARIEAETVDMQALRDGRPLYMPYATWGRMDATDDDLRVVAEQLARTDDPGRLFAYLRVFQGRALPTGVERVLGLVDHAEQPVRWLARVALARVVDPRVREVALARLGRDELPHDIVPLLGRNARPGDLVRVEQALFVPDEPWQAHALASDIVVAFADPPQPEAAGLLRFAYEHTNCGMCRADAVKGLAALERVPDWLRDEALHDAEQGVREAVGG